MTRGHLGRALGLIFACLARPLSADPIWHWDGDFSAGEREKLQAWLVQTQAAAERYAGPLPFDVHLHLDRRDGASEPVPWANTWRDEEQAIFFYVDPTYPLEDFLSDWTAAHEFSHLLLPYLGRRQAWASEGFASYLQHPVLVELGVLTPQEAQARRDAKMNRAVTRLATAEDPLPANLERLREARAYATFYWAGAVYWERADLALQENGSSLQQVLREFLRCCRMPRRTMDELAAVLDGIAGAEVFTRELALMRQAPGSPARAPREQRPAAGSRTS